MNDNSFEFTIKNTEFDKSVDDDMDVEKMIVKALCDRDIHLIKKCDKGHNYYAIDVQIHSEFENNDEEFENSINITYADMRPSINDRYIYDHIYCSYDLAKRLVSRDFKEIKCLAVEFDSGPISRSYNMYELVEHSEFYIQKYQ
jgi:hypothetical protein